MSDQSGALERFLEALKSNQIPYCVIGGQGVNAYVEPLVSLDLDLVIASDQVEGVIEALPRDIEVLRFPHTINLSFPGSDLRIQLQTDNRFSDFIQRAEPKNVLGIEMLVADIRDILQSKIWAALDESRRGSKRQKDLADIGRILEKYPSLRSAVPQEILNRLF